MMVGIMQPTYLPWCGYFEMMLRSDVFVFLDDVQFERKSWQTRNRVKGSQGPIWLRVPVKHGPQEQRICEVEIDNTQPWAADHLKSLRTAYRKAPWVDRLGLLEAVYARKWERLADMTTALTAILAGCLAPAPPVVFSSALPGLRSGKEDHIIDICRAVGADELYDAAGAEAILGPEPFREAGIRLVWQRYEHPVYEQLHGEFVPYMSVLDCILNEGPRAREIVLSGGRP